MLPVDWRDIRLVVFDVDGTLYDQRALRWTMLRHLLLDALQSGSIGTLKTISRFRRVREELAETGAEEFVTLQYSRTAEQAGMDAADVRRLVEDWMERRPLPHLRAARFPGLAELFQRLRERGTTIGVWSDYPAHDKLQALGLQADIVCSAGDTGIGRLKPCPTGLHAVMAQAGCEPGETIMIGDRQERDGLAAEAAGVRALIKSRDRNCALPYFHSYTSDIFHID